MTDSTGRPEVFEDLDAFQRSGSRVAQFDVTTFQDDPELLRAYADFVHAALNIGHLVKDGEVTAYVTPEERDEKLARAHRNWDSSKRVYDAWVNDGVEPTYKTAIESWATRQGLPIPEAVSA